jgi:hypothetical protein
MGRVYIMIHDTERRQRSFCYWYKLVSQAANTTTPHTDTRRKYLRGEGNCLAIVHNVGLLRGKLASPDVDGGWSESLWGTASRLFCEYKWHNKGNETSRSLSLHLSVVTTLFGHSLAQRYQESLSFYWQECATTMWTHVQMHPAQTIIPNSI